MAAAGAADDGEEGPVRSALMTEAMAADRTRALIRGEANRCPMRRGQHIFVRQACHGHRPPVSAPMCPRCCADGVPPARALLTAVSTRATAAPQPSLCLVW